jgi:hypothetical protein
VFVHEVGEVADVTGKGVEFGAVLPGAEDADESVTQDADESSGNRAFARRIVGKVSPVVGKVPPSRRCRRAAKGSDELQGTRTDESGQG